MISTRYVSFDIGIKNLGYCVMSISDCNTLEIEDWNIINLSDEVQKGKVVQTIVAPLLQRLHDVFIAPFDGDGDGDGDGEILYHHILVENQPVNMNPTMKSIQMIVYTFFNHHKVFGSVGIGEVSMVNAAGKLGVGKLIPQEDKGPDVVDAEALPKGYKRTKKLGVAYASHLISCNSVIVPDVLLKGFLLSKKKDDLADSLIQAVAWASPKLFSR
jgi:hypothetical protein